MKTELTKEQSQHLIDLGVSKEKASGKYITPQGKPIVSSVGVLNETAEIYPIFKLEDFLNGKILPKEIEYDGYTYKLTITCGTKYDVRYATEMIYHLGVYNGEELIDALYHFTCWYYGEFLKTENK